MVAAAEVPSLVPPSIFWWLIPLVVIVAIVGVAIPKPGGATVKSVVDRLRARPSGGSSRNRA
jgi:hypothetical protein